MLSDAFEGQIGRAIVIHVPGPEPAASCSGSAKLVSKRCILFKPQRDRRDPTK